MNLPCMYLSTSLTRHWNTEWMVVVLKTIFHSPLVDPYQVIGSPEVELFEIVSCVKLLQCKYKFGSFDKVVQQ